MPRILLTTVESNPAETKSLEIITYPHPTLRHESKPIKRVDKQLRAIIEEMFELMYDAKGIGLAANQVDLPLRLFVVNINPDGDRGEEQVFINPVISRPTGTEEKEEGCLSLPGVYAPVRRPEKIHFNAFDLSGNEISGPMEGMMARVVQHETDHLDGVMFIDRLSETALADIDAQVAEFETARASELKHGTAHDEETVRKRLAEVEANYC